MKDILMISLLVPNENGTGIQRRAAAHLRALTSRFRVHLLVFEAQPSEPSDDQRALLDRCATAIVIPAVERPRRSPINLPPFAIISELVDPTTARMVPRDDVLKEAARRLPVKAFDAVFCFRIRSGLIFNRMQEVAPLEIGRRIVDFDDIESLVALRSETYAPRSRGFEQGIIDKLKLIRGRRIEREFIHKFDDVLVCSKNDQILLTEMGPRAGIHAIPNSVPIPPQREPGHKRDRMNILFVGTMSYAPNQDAAAWFCRSILPRIHDGLDVPVEVTLVGFNPPKGILALGKIPGVSVTGGVERVEPYYQDCDLVIAPIRYGGGTRIKILEAMSHACPVVSTTIGAEGLEVACGENIIIADQEDEFAAACLSLLNDPVRRQEIGQAGRRFVEGRYGAPVVASALIEVIEGPATAP